MSCISYWVYERPDNAPPDADRGFPQGIPNGRCPYEPADLSFDCDHVPYHPFIQRSNCKPSSKWCAFSPQGIDKIMIPPGDILLTIFRHPPIPFYIHLLLPVVPEHILVHSPQVMEQFNIERPTRSQGYRTSDAALCEWTCVPFQPRTLDTIEKPPKYLTVEELTANQFRILWANITNPAMDKHRLMALFTLLRLDQMFLHHGTKGLPRQYNFAPQLNHETLMILIQTIATRLQAVPMEVPNEPNYRDCRVDFNDPYNEAYLTSLPEGPAKINKMKEQALKKPWIALRDRQWWDRRQRQEMEWMAKAYYHDMLTDEDGTVLKFPSKFTMDAIEEGNCLDVKEDLQDLQALKIMKNLHSAVWLGPPAKNAWTKKHHQNGHDGLPRQQWGLGKTRTPMNQPPPLGWNPPLDYRTGPGSGDGPYQPPSGAAPPRKPRNEDAGGQGGGMRSAGGNNQSDNQTQNTAGTQGSRGGTTTGGTSDSAIMIEEDPGDTAENAIQISDSEAKTGPGRRRNQRKQLILEPDDDPSWATCPIEQICPTSPNPGKHDLTPFSHHEKYWNIWTIGDIPPTNQLLKGIGLTTKILENAIVNSGGTVDPGQTGIAQLHAQITRLRDEKIQEQPARWRNDKWWVYVRPDGRCTVPEILRSLSVEAQQAQRELYIQKSRIRRARQNISLRIGKPVRGGKQPQQSRKPNITYNAITRPGQPSYTVLENDPMSLNADMRKNATQGPGEKRGTWHVNQNRGQQPPDQMTPEEFAEFTELVAGQCGQTAQEFFRHNVENESINTGISVETLAQQKNYNNEQMQWLELPSLGVGPWENASTETYVEPSGEEAQLSKESEAELLETDENEADSTKVLEARLEAELEAELLGSQVSEADSTKDLESRLQAELEAELLAMSHQSYAIPQAGTAEPLAIGGEVNKLSKDLEYDLFGDGS